MRILFIGTVKLSAELLKTLLDLNANIVGVCTTPSSSFNSDHSDLSLIVANTSIPVYLNSNLNTDEALSWMSTLRPDIIFCFGWSHLLGKAILNLPTIGVIGYHPASLPQNRGRHPLIWALALGLTETSSTFFFMESGADSGDILSQNYVPILFEDTAQSLYNRVVNIAKMQVASFLPQLSQGTYDRVPQDHSKANVWRKRCQLDGEIDWRMSSESIYNLVRALTRPYIGAHFIHDGQSIKVWHSHIHNEVPINIEPGKILCVEDERFLIKTGSGGIWITYQPQTFRPEVGSYL